MVVRYTDNRDVTLKTEIDDEDIEQAAHMWALTLQSSQIQDSLKHMGVKRFYFLSDLYVPHVFGEVSMKPLEILQRYGMNHAVYSSYDRLYGSLEEAIEHCGTNDVYSKRTFICFTELDGNAISVQSHPNPYGDASISLTAKVPIAPEQLIYMDLMANTETPLSNLVLSQCEQRDHEAYLLHIRSLQQNSPKIPTIEFDHAVVQTVDEIKKVVRTAK